MDKEADRNIQTTTRAPSLASVGVCMTKVLAMILEGSMHEWFEGVAADDQAGFRRDSSVRALIFQFHVAADIMLYRG